MPSKNLEDYEWFCPEPFTNYMNSVGGSNKPCCHIETLYWNNDIESFRKEFISGGGDLIDKCCIRCIKQEESGNKSFRQNYLENFDGKFAHKKKQLEENLDNPPLLTVEFKAQDKGLMKNEEFVIKTKSVKGVESWSLISIKEDLWFTDHKNNMIWKFNKEEKSFSNFIIPTKGSYPVQIINDNNNNILNFGDSKVDESVCSILDS